MGYYLSTFEFQGSIKKENVPKLTKDFLNEFDITKDNDGNIVDIVPICMKLTFDYIINENARCFETDSYIEMIGEDNEMFRWYITNEGIREVVPEIIWPGPYNDTELIALYESSKGNCCKCGCCLEDNTGNGLGSVFVMDKNGNFYCSECDHQFKDGDERVFEKELCETKIRYYVCGIGYDADDHITDYEREFGDFNTIDEAREKYDEAVREAENSLDEFFLDKEPEVFSWMIQLEKCAEKQKSIQCVDIVSHTLIRKI